MDEYKEEFNQPYHIIVEGPADRELIKRILRDRQIDGFQVGCGQGQDRRCLGKDGFSRRIAAIRGATTVQVQGYVIVADRDDNSADRFSNAARQFAKSSLPKPKENMKVDEGIDGVTELPVKTAIIMIPDNHDEGGLETLLLSCCNGMQENIDCVDDFCTCVQKEYRTKLHADKIRLRAIIAATHRSDPSLALSSWVTGDHCPFEMKHTALDFIADFLKLFGTNE